MSPRSKIKKGTIRNPRQNSQLIDPRSTMFQNPRIRWVFYDKNPQFAHCLRPNPSIRKPIHTPLEIYQTENVRQRQNAKIKIGRCIVHVLSNMQNEGFSRCCFVTSWKERQRNEQRTITHAYTAIVLVNQWAPWNWRNSQTSTKQTKTRSNKKTAGSAENIFALKRNQNIPREELGTRPV